MVGRAGLIPKWVQVYKSDVLLIIRQDFYIGFYTGCVGGIYG